MIRKTVRDVSTSLDMTEKRVGMTEKVGRSSLNVERLLPNGRISRQTPRANFARA
jgi:hypothetical protein